MIVGHAKRIAAVLATLTIALAPATAFAADDESAVEHVAAIAFDIAILRPAGFARIVLGSAIAVAVTPFALTNGQGEEMMQQLVGDSVEYTFVRDLGDF